MNRRQLQWCKHHYEGCQKRETCWYAKECQRLRQPMFKVRHTIE